MLLGKYLPARKYMLLGKYLPAREVFVAVKNAGSTIQSVSDVIYSTTLLWLLVNLVSGDVSWLNKYESVIVLINISMQNDLRLLAYWGIRDGLFTFSLYSYYVRVELGIFFCSNDIWICTAR